MKKIILALFTISFSWVYANAQITPDITVAIDGSGDFTSLQAAINAVPANSIKQTIIYIKRGLYNNEKLFVPADKKNVYLIGESRDETIISYHIYDCATGKCPTADAALWTGDVIRTSATLTVYGDGFRAENLTIRNTAGPVGQALALTIVSDKNIFVNCNIESYQDTIYLWISGKRSYFKDCLVIGRTDYIYGAGIGFFHGCEIRSWGGGWITAPSTPQAQPYGYVFYECLVTYALGSPRAGDDGAMVALGRPWHEYPKVAWLYCDMTDMIDPLGWPTTWNMDYAATSPDLHLYEYGNTGGGADMSGRADWVGIRALTEQEAAAYTVQNVFEGWDPTAQAPLVKTYVWSGAGATNNWMLADNWDPSGTPATGESATVNGVHQIDADGGIFEADLALKNGAVLNVTANSTVTYLTLEGTEIHAATEASLNGKISTKAPADFIVSGILSLNATIIGVHTMNKKGPGKLLLTTSNADFLGNWLLMEGTLEATAANSLGKGSIEISSGASLAVGHDNAFQPTSVLKVVSGSSLVLSASITLNEFYIDGVLQPVGEYTSSTNPGLISGTGSILVGRPSQFTFIGGTNGNWDVPAHFSPALMPEAGETVIVGREMETTSTVFPAAIIVNSPGRIRLRGTHKATGEITLNTGAMVSYATSGTGFTLDAPITIAGNVQFDMNSSNVAGSSMTLPGRIKGNAKITSHNSRNVVNSATVKLSGNNSEFTGTWDLTKAPANAGSVAAFEGLSANAFGNGKIEVALANRVIFSHAEAAGTTLNLSISGQGKGVLNTDVSVQSFILNGEAMPSGTYTKLTHPEVFEGDGSLIVASAGEPTPGIQVSATSLPAFSQTAGTPSAAQTYTVSATSITSDVTITPPANFEVSLNESDWFTTIYPLVISPTNGAVASTTIHVRLHAAATGSYSGNISHTASGIDPVVVAVAGVASNEEEKQLAFPGAEGGGRYAAGGRGGSVYEVTNLNDSGAGSLRDAVSQPNRTVVFRVSGVIHLKSRLSIKQNNITIAGQTAPGDGIAITGYTLNISASNIIIRYIRCRFSDVSGADDDAMNSFSGNYENIIVDHCSLSWSVDETGTFYGIKNFTLQWCLLSESLYNSAHDKGAHGYGGIWGGNNSTFHHNLLAHHTSRNPRFGGSRFTGKPEEEIVDFRNNVIYNWSGNSAYGGEGGHYNMVNNYYKPGPATGGNLSTSSSTNKRNRILQYTSYYYSTDAAVYPDTLFGGHFYIAGNYVHGYPDVTADNWTKGVQRDGFKRAAQLIAAAQQTNPFTTAPVTTESAEEAYTSVLANVGAILPRRDPIDARIISEVQTGTATFEGATYAAVNSTGISHPSGIIDSQTDVGGLPAYNSTTAPIDTDHDGMPGDWEIQNGLNPNDANDRNGIAENGYTNLENYLNSIIVNDAEPQPEIMVNGSINTLEQRLGVPATSQSYTVSGNHLQGEVTITPPAHFEVSVNGVSWKSNSSPLVLMPSSGSVSSTPILVRLNATAVGEFSGNVIHASAGAATVTLSVSGVTSTVTGLEKNAERIISVSPNPATSLLTIYHPGVKKDTDSSTMIFVYNITGIQMNVNVVEMNRTSTTINVNSYPAGMNFLEYRLKNERLRVRFIKE